MKEVLIGRVSNVLAWFGFAMPIFGIVVVTVDDSVRWDLSILLCLTAYGFFSAINYLMVGSMRLLPWQDLELTILVDKQGFKHRFSNTVAWLGFVIPFGLACLLWMEKGYVEDGYEGFVTGIAFWIGTGVIHYLMVGNMRLLPWLKSRDDL